MNILREYISIAEKDLESNKKVIEDQALIIVRFPCPILVYDRRISKGRAYSNTRGAADESGMLLYERFGYIYHLPSTPCGDVRGYSIMRDVVILDLYVVLNPHIYFLSLRLRTILQNRKHQRPRDVHARRGLDGRFAGMARLFGTCCAFNLVRSNLVWVQEPSFSMKSTPFLVHVCEETPARAFDERPTLRGTTDLG